MKFSLIDEVKVLTADKEIVACKNLSRSEEYLADHFPGFPVMPGVMMLETLVQTSAWLMRYSTNFQFSTTLLKETKALRFKSFVSPGDSLKVTSQVHKQDGPYWSFKASGVVGEQEVVSARLTLKQFNLREQNENLAANDQRLIDYLKTTWKEIQLTSAVDFS